MTMYRIYNLHVATHLFTEDCKERILTWPGCGVGVGAGVAGVLSALSALSLDREAASWSLYNMTQ